MSIKEEIASGKEVLSRGGVLIYPTDTVWGIGCDATDEQAVQRVTKIKNREESKGFVVLFSDIDMLSDYCEDVNSDLISFLSAERPTTVIIHGLMKMAVSTSSSDGSVAVRIPKDEFCILLINELGKPIISSSANSSGAGAPEQYSDIPESFLSEADYVINLLREEKTSLKPSRIIELLPSGGFNVIRE
jgi:L-threonylcarbamoyladenylate synthase